MPPLTLPKVRYLDSNVLQRLRDNEWETNRSKWKKTNAYNKLQQVIYTVS